MENNRQILEDLERRKAQKDNPCDSCDGTGLGESLSTICSHCLGQGILLTSEEYHRLLEIAGFKPGDLDDDSILDADQIG
jgi:hypothetical protein